MTRSIGGGTFDFTLIVKRGLMNQKNALSIIRIDPGASTAKNLETVLEPRDFRQWRTGELYDKLGLYTWEKFIITFEFQHTPSPDTYLFVLEHSRILELQIEMRSASCGDPL